MMKIGFITNAIAEQCIQEGNPQNASLKYIAAWAAEHGFDDLECGPSLGLDRNEFESVLSEGRISITTLIYCRNYLSTDREEASGHIEELKKRILFAGELGIEKVVTSTGIDKQVEEGLYDRDPAVKDRGNLIRKIPARSLDKVEDLFGPIVELAEKKGVKLCFENCPLMGNTAISPVMWRQIFERLDSALVGLAYDPSHLVWEMIEPYGPIEEFKDRIFHFHAKDTRIDRERLAQTGILTDFSWWKYTIPGRGELDWRRIFDCLKEIGYEGTISLEHEDEDYAGALKRVQAGILNGRAALLEACGMNEGRKIV